MPEYKAKGTITVEAPNGESIQLSFIASRIQSYAELGAKVGASVQAQVDNLTGDAYAQIKAHAETINALQKQIAEMTRPPALPPQPPPAPRKKKHDSI
jgi:hypothetical protein